jgi:hypothetical protein
MSTDTNTMAASGLDRAAVATATLHKVFDQRCEYYHDSECIVVIRGSNCSDLGEGWSILLPRVLKKGTVVDLTAFRSQNGDVCYAAVDELSKSAEREWNYATFKINDGLGHGGVGRAKVRYRDDKPSTEPGVVVEKDTQRLHFRLFDKDFKLVTDDWFANLLVRA